MVWKRALWWQSVSAGSPPSTSVKWGSRLPMPSSKMAALCLESALAVGRKERMAENAAGGRGGSAPRNRGPACAEEGSSNGNSHLGACHVQWCVIGSSSSRWLLSFHPEILTTQHKAP